MSTSLVMNSDLESEKNICAMSASLSLFYLSNLDNMTFITMLDLS